MFYYIRFRAKIFGPFDKNQLLEMKSKGKIGRTLDISENKINWYPASDWSFLFPNSSMPLQTELSYVVGNTSHVVEEFHEDDQEPSGANIFCTNINYYVKNHITGKQIGLLNNISLCIKPRSFVCFIGPSGSGKTTLLNILSGRISPSSGRICINGYDLQQNFLFLKQKMAVVSQRDILYEPLSAETSLTFTAKLRLPPNTNLTKTKEIVRQTIQEVGLMEQKSIRVSNLSGGQRKRVCLGNELISQPDILFLDEVTSGLDEQSDRDIMLLIRNISKNGKTAIIVTHSLANVEEFCDEIIVLTKQGRLAFCGSPVIAKKYFNVNKLGQIYDVLGQKMPEVWQNEFYHSEYFRKNINTLQSASNIVDSRLISPRMTFVEKVSIFFHQLLILLMRRIHIQLFDFRSLTLLAGLCILVAILISFLFGNTENISDIVARAKASGSIVFLMVISCFWFGCNNTATELVNERNIYLRERDVNLFPSAYFCSKILFFSTLGIFQSSVLFGIVFFSTKIDISFINGLSLLLLLNLVGTAIGLCISVFSKTERFAMAMVPVVTIPQIILAGCVHKIEEGLLKYFSVFFISAYWGYLGTTNSFLDDQMIDILNLDHWPDYSSILVLIFQYIIFICLPLFYLETEYFLFKQKQ
jgi:ABC-type multidrug transport system ATPase subunit